MKETITKENIDNFINGSENDFRIVYNYYWSNVVGIARRKLHNNDEALDFAQDLFEHIWLRREIFSGARDFDDYLFTTVRNRISDVLKKKINRKRLDEERLGNSPPPAVQNDVEEHCTQSDYNDVVEQALASTTPRRQLIYMLSREKGLSHQQIADQLNLAKQTVDNEMTSVLKIIRLYVDTHLVSIFLAVLAGSLVL